MATLGTAYAVERSLSVKTGVRHRPLLALTGAAVRRFAVIGPQTFCQTGCHSVHMTERPTTPSLLLTITPGRSPRRVRATHARNANSTATLRVASRPSPLHAIRQAPLCPTRRRFSRRNAHHSTILTQPDRRKSRLPRALLAIHPNPATDRHRRLPWGSLCGHRNRSNSEIVRKQPNPAQSIRDGPK